MTGVKLTIGRLADRHLLHSRFFIHFHRGDLTIGRMIEPSLRMCKQARKLHPKLPLKYMLKVETVPKGFSEQNL